MAKQVHYQHPHYPGRSFADTKVVGGDSGVTVLLNTGVTRHVRHEDISKKPLVLKDKKHEGSLADIPRYPVPQTETRASGIGKLATVGIKGTSTVKPEPSLAHPSLAFEIGHDVYYQRHDMAEPKIGRILGKGKDGAHIGLPGLEPMKVRWHHIIQRASLDLNPDERLDAAESLEKMGVPVDPTNLYVRAGEPKRGNQSLQALFQALSAEGVPVDLQRIANAPEKNLRRLLARLTEDHPSEKDDREEIYRPYPTANQSRSENRGHAGS